MAPRARFELAANRLTADCSTTELPRNAAERGISASFGLNQAGNFLPSGRAIYSSLQRKMRPGVIPAPRRWVMVGCLQGRRGNFRPRRVNNPLTLKAKMRKSSAGGVCGRFSPENRQKNRPDPDELGGGLG